MKNILILLALSLSLNLFAAPIKTCNTILQVPDEVPMPSKFEINDVNGELKATITQKFEGQTTSFEEKASVGDYSVRESLKPFDIGSNPDGPNLAENLVVHAMTVEPMGMKSGIVLSKVRSAKVYFIGEMAEMGGTAIVEARDGKGKLLGSYLGGFLVSPCK